MASLTISMLCGNWYTLLMFEIMEIYVPFEKLSLASAFDKLLFRKKKESLLHCNFKILVSNVTVCMPL